MVYTWLYTRVVYSPACLPVYGGVYSPACLPVYGVYLGHMPPYLRGVPGSYASLLHSLGETSAQRASIPHSLGETSAQRASSFPHSLGETSAQRASSASQDR